MLFCSLMLGLAGSRCLLQPVSSPVTFWPSASSSRHSWLIWGGLWYLLGLKDASWSQWENASFLGWTLHWKLFFGTPNCFILPSLKKSLKKRPFRTELFSYSFFSCFDCFWLGFSFAILWGVMSHCPLLFLTRWYKSMRFCYVHIFWSVKKLI